jgi:release factor glutamine methyltransferase
LGSAREARWLVEAVAGEQWPAATPVSEQARSRFEALVDRRAGGEPLQYVIGSWVFRTLDLMVDRRVLIPRPETEQVVEVALAELDRLRAEATDGARPAGRSAPPVVTVDLGTGSGAIALSVAAERPAVEVWATDVSPAALEVAAANLAGLGGRAAARVRLAEGAWWAALPEHLRGRVDLVISNPPYISAAEMTAVDAQVTGWEPSLALEAGPTGLEAIREILNGALAWLRPGGVAVVEIAPHQRRQAAAMAQDAGFAAVELHPDLAGHPRALVARVAPTTGPAAPGPAAPGPAAPAPT